MDRVTGRCDATDTSCGPYIRAMTAKAIFRFLGVVPAMCLVGAQTTAQQDSPRPEDPLVFRVDAVHRGLRALEPPPNLETPQACVENFVLSARRGDFARAARSLHFRLVEDVDEARASELARKLFYVLNQKLWIDWTLLPDRPDGMQPGSTIGGNDPLAGQPRRVVPLDTIPLGERDAEIYVQRVQAPDSDPVWLFSAHAVENIDSLYELYGPMWIERNIPDWAALRGWGRLPIWQWIALTLLVLISGGVSYVTTRLAERGIRALDIGALERLRRGLRWPVALATFSLCMTASFRWLLSLPGPINTIAEPLMVGLLVLAVCWFVVQTVSYVIEHVATRLIDGEEETSQVRRYKTQLTIARHTTALVICLVGASVFLVQIDAFRVIGIVLLTSAGAAALILGLAGQAVIGNAIAGLQVAFTQPFRIGDSVIVEGDWGRIERITYTYVDVKTWDERRLVIPIRHFITNPIENWSKNDLHMIKPIYLKVDYTADVSKIRETFLELVHEDEDYDPEGSEPECLVTDSDDETLTVRLTAGAQNPSAAWSMVCRVRESMFAWLREVEDGRFLPRRRLQLHGRTSSTTNEPAAAGSLEDRSRAELYEIAKARGIPGRSEMSKQELIEALGRGSDS